MAIVTNGDKIILRNGALGTGQACCCNKCSGLCSELNQCQPQCRCDISAPTSYGGKCVRNGSVDPSLTTQASCVECTTECEYNQCYEYMYVEEGQDCPGGWDADGWGGCSRITYPSSCSQCEGSCYSEGCTSTGNCGQWVSYPIGTCVTPNNCCEGEDVRLQVVLEISGMADGSLTGCSCLDGTYIADVVDWIEWPGVSAPGAGSGAVLLLQPGCTATDESDNSVPGQVFLEWSCSGTFALADWGFRPPPQPGGYPLTDYIRSESGGFWPACVGGEITSYVWNAFNGQCDPSNLTVSLKIQPV